MLISTLTLKARLKSIQEHYTCSVCYVNLTRNSLTTLKRKSLSRGLFTAVPKINPKILTKLSPIGSTTVRLFLKRKTEDSGLWSWATNWASTKPENKTIKTPQKSWMSKEEETIIITIWSEITFIITSLFISLINWLFI